MANRVLDEELRSPSGYSLEKLRARINDRVRHPCTGRFDPCLDIASDFEKDTREFKQLLGIISRSCPLDDWEQFNISADLDWLDDNVRFVHEKWEAQDKAMDLARNPSPCVHPPSQTYFS
jgi:hypothetical protein